MVSQDSLDLVDTAMANNAYYPYILLLKVKKISPKSCSIFIFGKISGSKKKNVTKFTNGHTAYVHCTHNHSLSSFF